MTQTSTVSDSIRYITIQDSDGFVLNINPKTWTKLASCGLSLNTHDLAKAIWLTAFYHEMLYEHDAKFVIDGEFAPDDFDYPSEIAAYVNNRLIESTAETLQHDISECLQLIKDSKRNENPITLLDKLTMFV